MLYEDEQSFAKTLAKRAGQIMSDAFARGVSREWKEDGTPLTFADTTINKLVIDAVSQTYPEDGVWGEEESIQLDAERLWVCDPVDGTMPFSHGLPISSFSLALVVDGRPVVGVVYDPFMDRLFSAVVGAGAFMNEEPIHVSAQETLENALIDVEGLPVGSDPAVNAKDTLIRTINNTGAHTTHYWSVILPTALVAAGQFTAAIFGVTKPEDAAAVKVIVEEAGGTVTDLFGNEQRYDGKIKGYIASNGLVHQQLVDIIKDQTQ